MNCEILLGVLEKTWEETHRKLDIASDISTKIHLDIIDGDFTNNKTILDPKPLRKYKKDLEIELHLMVKEPINYIEPWAEVGVKRFIGHIEMMKNQKEFIQEAKKFGEAGLALDGPTPVSKIQVNLSELDELLVYTSKRVGFSGPPLLASRLNKVRLLREKDKKIHICVDGGINEKTIQNAKEAGATRFVSTSYIFNATDPKKRYNHLKKLVSVS